MTPNMALEVEGYVVVGSLAQALDIAEFATLDALHPAIIVEMGLANGGQEGFLVRYDNEYSAHGKYLYYRVRDGFKNVPIERASSRGKWLGKLTEEKLAELKTRAASTKVTVG